MFEIVDHAIDLDRVTTKVSSPEAGAIVTFIGVTRNFTGEMQVVSLQYEAYTSMAISMMKKIGEMAAKSYDIKKIAITHRIGEVRVGEASVVIAVSASHRKPAFLACEYAIDTLKEIVPIWKKELMTSGEQKWIANNPAFK
ncbi:molybdenum cofactor biosynthesis protein MoaE [bacterium]|nr:molybdenum cofactor biosynthesis protein MoaE [bacterium]